MPLRYFAIRHKATGALMPAQMFARSSGSTWWEPTLPYRHRPENPAPRLFATEMSARRAAIAWEAGAWGARYEKVGCDPFDPEEYIGVGPKPAAAPRAKGDLEIIEFVLREVRR